MQTRQMIAALAIGLATGSAMAQDATPQVATSLPVSLTFDGYCDGISNLTLRNGFYYGSYDPSACGQPLVSAAGPKAMGMFRSGLASGAVLTLDSYATYGDSYAFSINGNGTFTVYDPFGVINSGTWTAVTGARATTGTRQSIAR